MAGICRTMQGGKISGCTNNGNIIYKAANSGNSNQTKLVNAVYAGGIVALVGANYGDGAFGTNAPADADAPFMASPVISGCTNNGEISLINTATGTDLTWMQYSAAGGITAWVWGGNATKYLTIDGCHNTASINVEQAERGNATSGITGVGGIIGRSAPTGRMGSTMGTVYGSLGAIYWTNTAVSACQDGFYAVVKNSDNSGSISASNRISNGGKFFHKIGCGGIAGILFGQYNGSMAQISGCTNTGLVVGCANAKTKSEASSGNNVGGIVGYGGSLVIENCIQKGELGTGGYNLAVAGILGAAYQKFEITGCTVKADVTRLNASNYSVYGSLILNYVHKNALFSRGNFDAYKDSKVFNCKIGGNVMYSKSDGAVSSALKDSNIGDTPDIQNYCVLGAEDLNTADKAYKLGYITISGTTHYTE